MTAAKRTRAPSRALSSAKPRRQIYRDKDQIASWAEEFDAKLATLTQRQDAFLLALDRSSTHTG